MAARSCLEIISALIVARTVSLNSGLYSLIRGLLHTCLGIYFIGSMRQDKATSPPTLFLCYLGPLSFRSSTICSTFARADVLFWRTLVEIKI